MSFDALETSLAEGRPIRLYDFNRGLRHWCYTSADRAIEYGGRSYLPAGISDDGIRQTGESSADALVVTGAASMEVGKLYRGLPPSSDVWLTIRDMHHEDGEALVSWVGLVVNVTMPEPDRYRITCNSLASSLDRPGLRLTWGRNCPNALGDHNCGVNLDAYKIGGIILSLDGQSVTVAAAANQPDGSYRGGVIAWRADALVGTDETRGIDAHAGQKLSLLGGTEGLSVGLAVTIYPGCNLLAQTCRDVFHNSDNFGGIPALPGDNPFDGNQAF